MASDKPIDAGSIDNQCARCRHYTPNPSDLRQGMCRRYPPTGFPVANQRGQMTAMRVWPPVQHDDTCGEFSPRVQQ